MKKVTLLLALACSALVGCSTFSTRQAELDKAPKGVRVFPPAVYLFVDAGVPAAAGQPATGGQTTIAYMPDYKRAYDVKPLTILAKQDFKIEIEDGQVKSLQSNQDTTAFLTFLKEAGMAAAKGAGVGLSSSSIKGTFGLTPGVYRLGDDGAFHRLP